MDKVILQVGYNENWSLDSTEAGFEVGDYKLIK